METVYGQEFDRGAEFAVGSNSGREPGAQRTVPVTRRLDAAGIGPNLIDATGVPVDAGAATGFSGSDVDALVGALLAALQAVENHCTCSNPTIFDSATHENVTVLFTDLVGWTHTSTRIDPESGDRVLKRHFATLRSVVAGFDGRYVKSLGDGAMVVFRTASSALSCAVAIQRAIDSDNRTSSHPLKLRVGISGGEVIRKEGDYFGDPVIEAARLCAAANAGRILVAQVVKDMAGRHARQPCQYVGSLGLKGLPHRVETLELGWNPVPSPAIAPVSVSPTGPHSLPPAVGSSSAEQPILALST